MSSKVQVNVRVDEEQKEEWERYVRESGEFRTLTGLVRAAVHREINGGHDGEPAESPALSNDVQELRDDINRIKNDVRWLKNNRMDTGAMEDLAQEVYNALEVLPDSQRGRTSDLTVDERIRQASDVVNPDSPDEEFNPQTRDDIIDEVGITEAEFHEAIEYLNEHFLYVEEVEIEGETHYFREE